MFRLNPLRCFAAVVVISLFISDSAAAQGDIAVPEPLHLLSQMSPEHRDLQLSEQDWAWLRHKRKLTLGVSMPGFPPLDIAYGDGDYEGISADVITLLTQLLGVEVSILKLPDRTQALEALQSGKIDLLSSANSLELDAHPVLLSHSYASDLPALFRRQGDSRVLPEDLSGVTIAMAADYRSLEDVQKQFPGARLVPFKSHTEALAALAFEHADVYLGDALSAHYMINHSFFNYVKFYRAINMDSHGFGFALKQDNSALQEILNKAIDSLGTTKLTYIIKRWAGGGFVLPEEKVSLTAQEQRWISQHPVVRLVVNDDQAPAAFFDEHDNFNGIVADLFDIITLRTGLQFEVDRTGSFNNLQHALKAGKADLAILLPSQEREAFLRFTHPFTTSSFAVVTSSSGRTFDGLQSLKGKRLAIANGQAVITQIRDEYPEIDIVTPPTTLDSLAMVAEGEADAAVMALSVARYYTSRLYDKKLQVAGITSSNTATANFAMRRSDTELQSILNKAILSIPPEDINSLTNRWRPNAVMSGQTWQDYRQVIAQIIAAALILVAIFWGRVFYLRKQINKRIAAEQALNDQLQFIQTLSDAMPQPVYARDREGRLLSCARSYEVALGLTLEDVLGKTALELPAGSFEAAPAFHQSYLHAMEHGEALQQRCEVIMGDRKRWIDHWIQPFRDSTGEIKGVVCGWLDITEQYHLIEELKTAKIQADEASRAKTTFLATMSHEIRTPMNAVIGTLELALKRADQGLIDRSGIEIAHTSAKSLLELIGDILDIVRIESGHLSLAPKRANLRVLVESVARIFEGLARQKGLDLILDIDSNLNGDVLIDPMRFKQVLSNLLGNAIKFTNSGFVRVQIAGKIVDADLLAIDLQVEDSGIGIAEEDQKRLFRPFAQVNQTPVNAQGGTGLGLVICRSLCEMMGGTLNMSSIPNSGTKISVALTLTRLETQPATENLQLPKAIPPRNKEMQVLIVDDHAVNRQLLLQQLDFLGYDTLSAENGAVALELWRSKRCDIIITDCQMPIMTGPELTMAIRREEQQYGFEPALILGLTADAQPKEVEYRISIGMNDCLIKPASLNVLEERLSLFELDRTVRQEENISDSHERQNSANDPYHIGIRSLTEMAGGDVSLVRDLVHELLKSNRQDLERLRLLVQKQDTEALSKLAHRIRGAASIVKDERLIESCRRMENASCDLSPTLQEKAAGIEQAMLELERVFSRSA